MHSIGHLGIDADMANIRAHYWILGLASIVRSVRNKCTVCRKKYQKILTHGKIAN